MTPIEEILQRKYSEAKTAARGLKAQNENYVSLITHLQNELAALQGPGHHVESCRVPGTFLRRLGSLWSCRCGQMWRLDMTFSCYDNSKRWVKA